MTRRILLIIPLALALVLLGAFMLTPRSNTPTAPSEETTENVEAPAAAPAADPAPLPDPVFASSQRDASDMATSMVAPQTATMVVEGASFPIRVAEGSSIEEAMRALKEEGHLTYTLRTYRGLGSFVKEINGKADTNEYYWILHINGEKSSLGISQARISSGDVIEWKYEHKY